MKKKITQHRFLFILFAIVAIPYGNAQKMEFSTYEIECSVKHNHAKHSKKAKTSNRAEIAKNDAFLTELFKKPKTAEFIINYNELAVINPKIRNAVEFVTEIVSREIISTVPIRVQMLATNTTGALAAANQTQVNNFPNSPIANVNYPKALANALAGFDLNPDRRDFSVIFSVNPLFDIYYGLDGNNNANELDFVSILLHEFMHGIGFAYSSTNSAFFERFEDKNGNKLSTFPLDSPRISDIFDNQNIFLDQDGKPEIDGVVGGLVNGLSHLEETRYLVGDENSLMTPFFNAGEINRNIGPFVRELLNNMGWQLPTALTNNTITANPENIDIVILEGETLSDVTFDITNISGTSQILTLNSTNNNISFLNGNSLILPEGETRQITVQANANNITERLVTSGIEIIRLRDVIQTIPVSIRNENIAIEQNVSLSKQNLSVDGLAGVFQFNEVTITNTGNTPLTIIPLENTEFIELGQERRINLEPNQSVNIDFSINLTNNIVGETLMGALLINEQVSNTTLAELPITVNVVSSEILNFSQDSIDFNFDADQNTEALLMQPITITNTSPIDRLIEVQIPNNLLFIVTLADRFINVPANGEITLNFMLNAEDVRNRESNDSIEILDAVSGANLNSLPTNINISGLANLTIDLILGTEIDIVDFETIILGDEVTEFVLIESNQGLPTIREVFSSNPDIEVLLAFDDPPFFQEYSVSFTPTQTGIINETISIILEEDPDNPILFDVKAIVIEPGVPSANIRAIRDFSPLSEPTNLGQIIVGGTITNSRITLENLGDADLEVLNITSSNPNFTATTDSNVLPMNEETAVNVIFSPVETGFQETTITITTNDVNKPTISLELFGNSIETPQFDVDAEIETTLETGTVGNNNFTINHLGGSALDYCLDSDISYEITDTSSTSNFNNITTSGIDITPQMIDILQLQRGFLGNDDYNFLEITLPFDINYFGLAIDNLDLTPFGLIGLTDVRLGGTSPRQNLFIDERPITNTFPEDNSFDGFIAASFTELLYDRDIIRSNESSLTVFYQVLDNSVIVQYNNLIYNANGNLITFQIIINRDGSVEYIYDTVENGEGLDSLIIGLENISGTKGNQVDLENTQLTTGLALKFAPNMGNFITAIQPLFGRVQEQNSANIDLTLDATTLEVGVYNQIITVSDTRIDNTKQVNVILRVIDSNVPLTTNSPVETDKIQDNSIRFYPNPAINNVTVKLGTLVKQKAKQIIIADAFNRTLITKKIQGNTESSLTVDKLPKGLYVIRVTDATNTVLLSKKLIKQ